MPGFAIHNTDPQNSKNNKAEFRRKHRWRVVSLSGNVIRPQDFLYLKSSARPNFTIEEAEVHHDQEVAYWAGKQSWEPLELVFYDAVQGQGINDISEQMYAWVNDCINISQAQSNLPSQYKRDMVIQSTGANGVVDEEWTLYGCWAKESNWNDLDYTNTEIQEVNMTIRFDRAERTG